MLKKWAASIIRGKLGFNKEYEEGEKPAVTSKTLWFVAFNVIFGLWYAAAAFGCPLLNEILAAAPDQVGWMCDIPEPSAGLIAFVEMVVGPMVWKDRLKGNKKLK